REQNLILFLSKNQGYVTSKELVSELNVSQKTVYRLIKKINNDYENGPLILSERGRGYRLDYEKYINHQRNNNKFKEEQYTPKERRKRIWKYYCCRLLNQYQYIIYIVIFMLVILLFLMTNN